MEPLIIEVRANEYADREKNIHIPYGARAIVADALGCADAGATIYHWHPRDEDGVEHPDDSELNAAVISALRADGRLVLHATFGFTSTQGQAAARIDSLRALIERRESPDVVPADIGAMVSDRFDWRSSTFETDDSVLLNRTGYLDELLRGIRRTGVTVMAVVWSPGAVRVALALRRTGALGPRTYWQLGFTGDAVPGGMPATVPQLEAFLDVIPPGEPWTVHVRDGDGLSLAAEAIQRGGHVSIGLGDDPYERLGNPSNAELVGRLAEFARTIGRPLASTEQAREIVGVTRLPSGDAFGG